HGTAKPLPLDPAPFGKPNEPSDMLPHPCVRAPRRAQVVAEHVRLAGKAAVMREPLDPDAQPVLAPHVHCPRTMLRKHQPPDHRFACMDADPLSRWQTTVSGLGAAPWGMISKYSAGNSPVEHGKPLRHSRS